MNAATLARRAPSVDQPASRPVEARAGDRWFAAGRVRTSFIAVVAGSLALHAAAVAVLLLTERSIGPSPPHEIAVEIVQEAPKPPVPVDASVVKRESAKPAPLPPPPVPKVATAQADPSRPAAAKPLDPPKPAAPPPAATDARAALQQELAALKAEHAALQATAPRSGSGALAHSFLAIAMPNVGDGDGEAVSYHELVFSQLAKAKDIGQRRGMAGSAGVQFEIDGAGRLVSVAIVSPSGIAGLDAEALAIVHRAAPFPPPPEGAERQFVANVNFVPEAAP